MTDGKQKWVYAFEEGDGRNKMLLGGKGANLCEMTQIGLNVPPGFVITTEACLAYLADSQHRLPDGAMDEVRTHMAALERKTGKRFGGGEDPLLVSVRSGSAMSMPGMMDTILNLGLNATTLRGADPPTGNERFGYDAYRRFIQLFGKVALGVPDALFDEQFEAVKTARGVKQRRDARAPTNCARSASASCTWCRSTPAGPSRPTRTSSSRSPSRRCSTPGAASARSITAANSRSPRRWPTAPRSTWCTMVFGNMGDDSATGVGFTRDPGTGENHALRRVPDQRPGRGRRRRHPHAEAASRTWRWRCRRSTRSWSSCATAWSATTSEVQDFEFTIERGTLYCLQTRNGKMNAAAHGAHLGRDARRGTAHRARRRCCASTRRCWSRCCSRASTRSTRRTPSRTGLPASPGRRLRHRRVRRRPRRETRQRRARRSSWCARKPSRRTSTASSPPRAS